MQLKKQTQYEPASTGFSKSDCRRAQRGTVMPYIPKFGNFFIFLMVLMPIGASWRKWVEFKVKVLHVFKNPKDGAAIDQNKSIF